MFLKLKTLTYYRNLLSKISFGHIFFFGKIKNTVPIPSPTKRSVYVEKKKLVAKKGLLLVRLAIIAIPSKRNQTTTCFFFLKDAVTDSISFCSY